MPLWPLDRQGLVLMITGTGLALHYGQMAPVWVVFLISLITFIASLLGKR